MALGFITDDEKLRGELDELDRELRKTVALISQVHFLTDEGI